MYPVEFLSPVVGSVFSISNLTTDSLYCFGMNLKCDIKIIIFLADYHCNRKPGLQVSCVHGRFLLHVHNTSIFSNHTPTESSPLCPIFFEIVAILQIEIPYVKLVRATIISDTSHH